MPIAEAMRRAERLIEDASTRLAERLRAGL
jgi:hypothetical protein